MRDVEFTIRQDVYSTGRMKVDPLRFEEVTGVVFDPESLDEQQLRDYAHATRTEAITTNLSFNDEEWFDFEEVEPE